jgi:phosphohistidine phosphatase
MSTNAADQRTLIIVRHAKAESFSSTPDLSRPLTPRGHADANAAGAWLAAHGYRPDLVICSPARRTRQTWHGIAVGLVTAAAPAPAALVAPAASDAGEAAGEVAGEERPGAGGEVIRFPIELYEAGIGALLRLVAAIDPQYATVLLVGHNPTTSQLSAVLDPRAPRDSVGLRTCGIAVHQWDCGWDAWGPGTSPLIEAYTARTG